jgi:ATP-binding cassette subfamily B protein
MAPPSPEKVNIIEFLKPYRGSIALLLALALLSNGFSLLVPRRIGHVIDAMQLSLGFDIRREAVWLLLFVVLAAVFALLQIVVTGFVASKIGYDLRAQLAAKLSRQSYAYVSTKGSSELLTIFTSDVDTVRNGVSQVIVGLFTAVVTLVGSIYFLLITNVRLALLALSTLLIIAATFAYIFSRLGPLFQQVQMNLGRINKVINESIVGAMLIRVLNSQRAEQSKFERVNARSRELGGQIVDMFSALIPMITFVANVAIALIVWYGGRLVVGDRLGLGQLSAFISYFNLLITPIFIIGFVSNMFSRSLVSLGRIQAILRAEDTTTLPQQGQKKDLRGKIEFRHVHLRYGERVVLKDISFVIQPQTRTAIIGPTASGKSQLIALLAGLIQPTSGEILVDDLPLTSYDRGTFLNQLAIVFQESSVFQATLKENILFRHTSNQGVLEKALKTAALEDVIKALPQGLETMVSERGGNLSGGQKQRLMLARALALEPKILLLDDFTARVDRKTEQDILERLQANYPGITLLSVTQKIEPVKSYDQILLLMEGELLAAGTHDYLLHHSFEYQQIAESQKTSE